MNVEESPFRARTTWELGNALAFPFVDFGPNALLAESTARIERAAAFSPGLIQIGTTLEKDVWTIAGLFRSAKYSDLTIVCGTAEIKVHKAVVCAQSGFFERACRGDFKVNRFNC